MADKTRYSDEELQEFKVIIDEKLATARHDYSTMMRQLMNVDNNDVDDTSPTYKALEEGSPSAEIHTRPGSSIGENPEQNLRHRPHHW